MKKSKLEIQISRGNNEDEKSQARLKSQGVEKFKEYQNFFTCEDL